MIDFFGHFSLTERIMLSNVGVDPETLYWAIKSGARAGGTGFMFFEDAKLIGVCLLVQTGKKRVNMESLAIHPDYRRRGFATWFFSYLISVAHHNGIGQVTARMRIENAKIYEFLRKMNVNLTRKDDMFIMDISVKDWVNRCQ